MYVSHSSYMYMYYYYTIRIVELCVKLGVHGLLLKILRTFIINITHFML